MLVKMLLMFSFVITLAAGVTTAFMDRLYMCLKMANIVYDHIVYKGSKLESESEREREIERDPGSRLLSDIQTFFMMSFLTLSYQALLP